MANQRSIRYYKTISGASSHSDTSVSDDNLGGYFGSEVTGLVSQFALAGISGANIKSIQGITGVGSGTLQFIKSTNILRFKPPGGNFGSDINIPSDINYDIPGSDVNKSINIGIVNASLPAVDASDTLTLIRADHTVFSDVDAYRAITGEISYAGIGFRNMSTETINGIELFIKNSIIRSILTVAYAASGKIQVTVVDATGFPMRGYYLNKTTSEVFYVSGRNGNNLQVLASNRGLRGSGAVAGSISDKIVPIANFDLGFQQFSSENDKLKILSTEINAPSDISFSTPSENGGIVVGSMASLMRHGLFVKRFIGAGSRREIESQENDKAAIHLKYGEFEVALLDEYVIDSIERSQSGFGVQPGIKRGFKSIDINSNPSFRLKRGFKNG